MATSATQQNTARGEHGLPGLETMNTTAQNPVDCQPYRLGQANHGRQSRKVDPGVVPRDHTDVLQRYRQTPTRTQRTTPHRKGRTPSGISDKGQDKGSTPRPSTPRATHVLDDALLEQGEPLILRQCRMSTVHFSVRQRPRNDLLGRQQVDQAPAERRRHGHPNAKAAHVTWVRHKSR